MTLVDKLQVKAGQSVAVLGLPEPLELDLAAPVAADPSEADVLLVFVTNRAELDERRAAVVQAASRDALTWIAYPKAGQLGTDLNRDSVAEILSAEGVRPVRQIAVDDVWSALRLRPGSL